MNSIVILGKGKSVKKITKEYVDSFDKVAFVNLLRVSGFEQYISNRCHYLFFHTNNPKLGYAVRDKTVSWENNRNFLDRGYYIENGLGIEKIFNISNHSGNTISKFLNGDIKYDTTFRRRMMDEKGWERASNPEKNWFPPTGILALEYFIDNNKYKKISLVGFDFYEVVSGCDPNDAYNQYYFLDTKNRDITKINRDEKDPNGIIYNNSEINPHTPKNQIDFVIRQIKRRPDIQFEICTNSSLIKELKIDNLKIL